MIKHRKYFQITTAQLHTFLRRPGCHLLVQRLRLERLAKVRRIQRWWRSLRVLPVRQLLVLPIWHSNGRSPPWESTANVCAQLADSPPPSEVVRVLARRGC